MKCQLIREMKSGLTRELLPAGTVIDDPAAWRLVRLGVAVPFDDECQAKANLTPEQLAGAQAAYEAVGIHPEDRDAYRAGWMTGYRKTNDEPKRDALGNTSNIWEQGPKWGEYAALLDEAENESLSNGEDEPHQGDESPATEPQ